MPLPHPASLIPAIAAVLCVSLCAGHGRADDVADVGCPESAVREVLIEGCAPGDCDAHEPLQRLLGTTRDKPAPRPVLLREEARLVATRLVVDAALRCEDGVLTARVTPTVFIRRVDVSGQSFFVRRDLLKRVFLRAGTPLAVPGDGVALAEVPDIARQLESLGRLYRQNGLEDVVITPRLRRVSATRVDLEFVIDEGTAERVDTVDVLHVHRGGEDPRCPQVKQSRLERVVGLGAGDLFTRTTERQITTRVRRALQEMGYERPSVEVELPPPTPDGRRNVTVRVTTERCWRIELWTRDLPGLVERDQLSYRWTDPLALAEATPLARGDGAWEAVELEAWSASLPFGESGSFDRSEASRALDAFTREMRARGYPFAEVRLVFEEAQQGGVEPAGSDVRGRIAYFITTNLQRRVERVELHGVSALDEEIVRGKMKTRAYGFFSGSGTFDEARVLGDLETIADLYRDEGYFRLRFIDGGDDGEDRYRRERLDAPDDGTVRWRHSVGPRGFLVDKRENGRHLTVIVRVDEGAPLRVASIQLLGFRAIAPTRILELLGLEEGRPFRPRLLDEGLARIEKAYRRRGHYRFRLAATCSAGGDPEAAVDCRDPSLALLGAVHVHLDASEDRPFRIGSVVWRGSSRSDPHILTRDLPRPGELLDVDRVNEGLRLMRGLPVFNAVRVDVVGLEDRGRAAGTPEGAPTDVPDEDATADLVVAVEEAETRFLDIAAGLRSIQRANIGRIPRWAANGTGLLVDQADRIQGGAGRPFALDLPDILMTLEVEYLDLHAAGLGEQLRVPFVAGFSLSEFLRLATFNPSYSWRRFLDTRMTLTARAIAELDRVTDPLDRLELGAEADLIVPIGSGMLAGFLVRGGIIRLAVPSDPCVNCLTAPPFGFGTSLPQVISEDVATTALCAEGSDDPACNRLGFRPQFSVSARWRLDTRDTPLHPSRGIVLSAATSFILDRDRFALSPTFNRFLKWELSAGGTVSLGDLIFAGVLRYGGSLTFGQDFLPADERFTLGGFNGLRGFSDNGICRYNKDGSLDAGCPGEFGGNVVLNGSVELRVPLLSEFGLWLGFFLDFGALARTHEDIHPASFRLSGGVGLRYLLGDVFPFRLDIGFPLLSRRCLSVSETGECVLEAPSQFHVDFLYPF